LFLTLGISLTLLIFLGSILFIVHLKLAEPHLDYSGYRKWLSGHGNYHKSYLWILLRSDDINVVLGKRIEQITPLFPTLTKKGDHSGLLGFRNEFMLETLRKRYKPADPYRGTIGKMSFYWFDVPASLCPRTMRDILDHPDVSDPRICFICVDDVVIDIQLIKG